ncbi:FAD dependent oxidoreductase [Thelonectria olida]|uniref:FAD dependent oxidoreductase n=1 Tax=Thelonectria olida TaxID=1576542 RepID=A0A9P8VNI4_9HYPO|nr:FAD dependent oxidoreductase [Thelonectria olida]
MLALLPLVTCALAHTIHESSRFKPTDIITKDVAIVGGGASGTYAAIRLKDKGKTVALIEQKDHLGGHVDTYTDPATGIPIDYGVRVYLDLPGVKEFFGRFNISTVPIADPGFQNVYIDFTTGKAVPGYSQGGQTDVGIALTTYAQLAVKYNDYYFPGFWKLTTAPVPDELSMPFGQLVEKYNLTAALPVIWNFASGVGDFANVPSFYVFYNFGAAVVQGLLTGTLLVPDSHNNSQLYAAAQEHLASDVLLNSVVSNAHRDDKGVKLVVKTPTGTKLVKAKKLLVTIPPTGRNMHPFDLDHKEKALFAKWKWENWYVAIFKGSGLPANLTLVNTRPNPRSLYAPTPNFVWTYTFTGIRDLYATQVVGKPNLSLQGAKDLIRAGLRNINAAGTYATKRIDFVAWAQHAPLQLAVSAKELVCGFYKELYALQGRKSTWYTGAAWALDYTSILWVFTEETILPGVIAGL